MTEFKNSNLSDSGGKGFESFAALVNTLGTSTKTNDKLDALSHFFTTASARDKVWVIAIFSGRRPKRVVNSTKLQIWCTEMTGLPQWLFEESYHTVGDLAETIALLLPAPKGDRTCQPLHYFLEKFISIEKQDEPVRKQFIIEAWESMDTAERFVFNKLITGGFRIGVSQSLMVNALSKAVHLPSSVIAHRITGNWDPSITVFDELLGEYAYLSDHSKPYPFYLAYAIDGEPKELGDPQQWIAEWKWDGIRGQLIKRDGQLFVWSRGEELITDKFPEYHLLKELVPEGVVLDGEILPFRDGPLPFAILQTRIGRKNVSKKHLQDAPVIFLAYDILELDGEDIRGISMSERRKLLEKMVGEANHPTLQLSPAIAFSGWEELKDIRTQARKMGSEGIMLKRKNSAYQSGRKRGDWWKWKIDPLVIDAVMIYAQKGHGRRSNLYTDYTFAVKDGDTLVSFAKAYSGLTDKEMAEVDNFVKRNSLEKFGPVRTVKPELVFELAFEGIAASNRHKSGVALRFPRISRWRRDKKPGEINTLDDLRKMLELYGMV